MRANRMRFSTIAVLASFLGASCGAALAQVPTGDEVSVNPVAGSNGVLLYPGGQYMRSQRPLLQPGQNARNSGAIQLHMPTKRPVRAAAAPSAPRAAVAPRPAAPRVAAAPAAPAYNPGYGAFGPPQGAAGLGGLLPSTPAPQAAPRQQVAKANPPPSTVTQEPLTPGLTKRSVILFAAGASDPAQSALGAIKFLAGDLNAAMTGPASRVQLLAYGGERGDKGSDARRLSLKRALAIRQVLIDDGVASERIDVRAMGGADDGGPVDRVDVYVKS